MASSRKSQVLKENPWCLLITPSLAGLRSREPPGSRRRLLQSEPWWCGTEACRDTRALNERGRRLMSKKGGNNTQLVRRRGKSGGKQKGQTIKLISKQIKVK